MIYTFSTDEDETNHHKQRVHNLLKQNKKTQKFPQNHACTLHSMKIKKLKNGFFFFPYSVNVFFFLRWRVRNEARLEFKSPNQYKNCNYSS